MRGVKSEMPYNLIIEIKLPVEQREPWRQQIEPAAKTLSTFST
jgi:hypothetical protein